MGTGTRTTPHDRPPPEPIGRVGKDRTRGWAGVENSRPITIPTMLKGLIYVTQKGNGNQGECMSRIFIDETEYI